MIEHSQQASPTDRHNGRPGRGQPDVSLPNVVLSLVIIVAVFIQFRAVYSKLESPFFQRVWRQPSRLLDRYPDFQCCGHLNGLPQFDSSLEAADRIIPRSERVVFYSPAQGQIDSGVATALSVYLLYPRPVSFPQIPGLNEASLNDIRKLGVGYVLIYRAKEEEVAELPVIKLSEGIYLLNLKNRGFN
ncbi:MAG TPA: hypothetical protein VJ810_17550 [Blastocatellia bacterium]|nr:hypothetical protein [Blastocatellia bacterium]